MFLLVAIQQDSRIDRLVRGLSCSLNLGCGIHVAVGAVTARDTWSAKQPPQPCNPLSVAGSATGSCLVPRSVVSVMFVAPPRMGFLFRLVYKVVKLN